VTSAAHADRLAAIAAQMRARPAATKITIRKATPTHSIRDTGYKSRCYAVDVSSLTEILEIDATNRVARVEGQAVIGDLCRATLAQGLVPAVVPEYRRFTIAGLISGEGIQSSSHRYGVFSQCVDDVELLTADGSVAHAARGEDDDLVAGLRESLGTLGLVTAATVRLVPAKRFVKLTTRRFHTRDDYLRAFVDALGVNDFHEGVVFGPALYVLVTGDFVDEAGALPVILPDEPGQPYFYQQVRAAACARDTTEQVVSTLAYLCRSERGMWWMVECYADFPLLTETEWGRRQVDNDVAKQYERSGFRSEEHFGLLRDRCVISQDMAVTLARLDHGIRWVQEHLGVYPLWNCAIQTPAGEYLVDIGIYGEPTVRDYRYLRDMRALQKMADAPSLWGVSYLTWDEIRATDPQRFDAYNRARQRLRADDAFLHIKDKVVWFDPDQPDRGKIPRWRLYRSFGPRWYLNPLAYLLLVVVLASKLIWRRPAAC
jgi:delta24-sterol reductase